MYARPVKNKGRDVIRAIKEILKEVGPRPKPIVHDKAGEFRSGEWVDLMNELGIVDRYKGGILNDNNADSRATLQNISIMDSRMGTFAATLKAEAGRDKAWHKYVDRAVNEVNEQEVLATKKSGRGMLSVSPDQATGATGENEALIQFNLKKAAAEGYAHGSKIQKRARERLDADGAFKVMDPVIYEGAEGRRRKKTKDPTFTGPIKYIDRTKGDPNTPGFKGGFVIAKDGKKYLAGKVQSIPDTTRATPPPDPEDEETRRQATRRKELRELGVIKVIEDYLRLNAGGARITDIATHVRKKSSDDKWQTIIASRTKTIAAVIKLFPDKFEFYDADKGG